VIFYSDNCCGQQKNKYIRALYVYAVQVLPNIKSITHKFLVKGHSQNENGAAHSVIEREIKKALLSGPIFVPSQYAQLMRSAKKRGKKYDVIELSHAEFLNVKILTERTSNKRIFKIAEIAQFKVTKDKPQTVFFKTSFGEDNWEEATLQPRRGSASDPSGLQKLFKTRQQIDSRKKESFLKLIEKNIIPKVYEPFYKAL